MAKRNFGKYAILSETKHVFEKEPGWWWLIKPPTAQDELEVAKVLATDKFRIDLDGTRINQIPTNLEIAIREIAVTFGGTNIPASESSDEPVLKKGATTAEIEDILKEMPRDMVLELWRAVGEAIPGWGPRLPNASKPAEARKDEDEAGDEKN